MIRHTTPSAARFAAGAAMLAGALASGCVANGGSVFIEGVLPITAPECLVDPNGRVFVSGALLDVGSGQDNANALVIAARVVTNLPNTFAAQDDAKADTQSPNYPTYGSSDSNVINFLDAEVFFATDQDRPDNHPLADLGLAGESAPRRVGVGGTVYNTQSQLNTGAAIVATIITQEDAITLQPWVASQPSQRGHVLTNIRFNGTTTGSGTVRTPPFVFPVELCQGCLVVDTNTCPNGVIDNGCVRGVDETTVCGP